MCRSAKRCGPAFRSVHANVFWMALPIGPRGARANRRKTQKLKIAKIKISEIAKNAKSKHLKTVIAICFRRDRYENCFLVLRTARLSLLRPLAPFAMREVHI
jgi:hypothetical protein